MKSIKFEHFSLRSKLKTLSLSFSLSLNILMIQLARVPFGIQCVRERIQMTFTAKMQTFHFLKLISFRYSIETRATTLLHYI